MGPAPGQQEARAGEVSGREKQGGAYGRPHAGAHKQRGTRGRAVAARARAKSGPETAISEQNLTSIKIQEGTPLDELNSGTPAACNRSGPSSAAARCHGRPGPGPGGAAAQPNVGTCEICSTFATLLQKLQHTRLTAWGGHGGGSPWQLARISGTTWQGGNALGHPNRGREAIQHRTAPSRHDAGSVMIVTAPGRITITIMI